MPLSKDPALMESPFIIVVILTLSIGNKLQDVSEVERKIAGAMVELVKAKEISL